MYCLLTIMAVLYKHGDGGRPFLAILFSLIQVNEAFQDLIYQIGAISSRLCRLRIPLS